MSGVMIVESPNKIKKISHYLKEIGMGDVQVLASVGHIRDLPQNELGVNTTTFIPTYVVSPDKTAVVSKLKAALKGAEKVYLATDPDREGESISWHLYDALGIKRLQIPVHRVKFNAINKKSIEEAIKAAGQIDMHLVYAQEARRVLDRLVGYLVSPRLGSKLSAGRVQSPALRLIVEREDEIRNFKPLAYFDVRANISDATPWYATWDHQSYREKGQNYWLGEAVATEVARVKQLRVVSVEKRQRSAKAPAPFTTSSLQQAASSILKMSPDQTMRIAQNLFSQGAITYHRTDSPNLTSDSISDVVNALKAEGLPYSEKPNTWAVKGGAQEAHEAIRPTDFSLAFAGETEDEQALYQLIKERTLACQMPDAIFDVTNVLFKSDVIVSIDGEQAIFKAHGETLTNQKGWMGLVSKPHEQEEDTEETQALPPVREGEVLQVEGKLLNKKTEPPARYTEASLIKKLESLEIGRPSTYAAILNNIKTRDYVVINKKRQLEPTEKGNGVIAVLKGAGFSFLEYDWTKEIEQRLDAISLGKDKYIKLVAEIHNILEIELKELPENERVRVVRTTVDGMQCKCGGEIDETDKLYQCKDCKATVWKVISNRDISKKEAADLFLGEELPNLTGFINKTKKEFSAGLRLSKEGKLEFCFEETEKPASASVTLTEICLLDNGSKTCGGAIVKTDKNWQCKSCGATVWAAISGRSVANEEAITLFSGGSVEMDGLTSKAGKKFNAVVTMKDGKTAFEFK